MTLQKRIVKILRRRGETVSTAESCTGGMIASLLVSVPGASDVLKQSFVTYSEETKDALLYLDPKIIRKYGVVSYATAKAMAEGQRKVYGSDLSISSTGVAGPGPDGSIPQGTVYISASYRLKTMVRKYHFKGSRNLVRLQASFAALKLAYDVLEEV